MFEKEAEEYAEKHTFYDEYSERHRYDKPITEIFKDGAEFGYNKAKEEMQENGLALQSDMDKTIEQNIQLKKQIEKMKSCQNCKFEDLDCLTEPCSVCCRLLGEDIKREGTSDKWEIEEDE